MLASTIAQDWQEVLSHSYKVKPISTNFACLTAVIVDTNVTLGYYTTPTKSALENDPAKHQFFSRRVATSASQKLRGKNEINMKKEYEKICNEKKYQC